MSVLSLFRNAILTVGQSCQLQRPDSSLTFSGCLQPKFSFSPNASGVAGWGNARIYHLYAVLDDVSRSIQIGDIITLEQNSFQVTQCEPFRFANQDIYLKLALQQIQRGGV